MQRRRLMALAAGAALVVFATARPAATGEKREDPESRGYSGSAPAKKFDLGKVELPIEPSAAAAGPSADGGKKEAEKPALVLKAAEVAPAGAAAVLEVPSVSRLRQSLAASPLGRFLDEDGVRRLLDAEIVRRLKALPAAGEGLPSGADLLGIIDAMKNVPQGDLVVAVYPPSAASRDLPVLLVAQLEPAGQTGFLDATQQARDLAGLGSGAAREDRLAKGDFEYSRYEGRNGLTVTWGFVGNQVVIALGKGGLYEKALAAAASKGDGSLAREASWLEARKVLGDEADLYLRYDVKALARLAAALPAAEGAKLWAGVPGGDLDKQLEGLKYQAIAVRLAPEAVRERFFTAAEAGSPALKMVPAQPPAEAQRLAKLIPLDAVFFGMTRLEPEGLAFLAERMRQSVPEQARPLFLEGLAAFEKRVGLSLDKDILPALAGDWAVALTAVGEGASLDMDVLLVLRPAQAEKLRNVLAALEKASGREMKTELYLGAQLKLEDPKAGGASSAESGAKLPPLVRKLMGMGSGPLGPIKACAFAGNMVILGTGERAVRMAVRQNDPTQRASCILDRPEYKSAREALGSPAGEFSFGFLDLRRVAEAISSLAGASARAAPPVKAIGELGCLAYSQRREPNGISEEVYSPVGVLPALGTAAVWGGLAGIEARAERDRLSHEEKLKTIWRGLQLFATDFGRYPLSLSELYPNYVRDLKAFLTPDQERQDPPVAIAGAEDIDAKTGYSYVSALKLGASGASVQVYATKPSAGSIHWCLLVNGKVGSVSAACLKDVLVGKIALPSPAEKLVRSK